ncbi:MAG: tetratricopeptide repeat protein, partial [Planctomycetaceae bacterium]|nr:tetratricopeptide repeat protein [Planctomycetaceae bacterium]
MDVSRTRSPGGRRHHSNPAGSICQRSPLQTIALAACCGASLWLTGCQSMRALSGDKTPEPSLKDTLAKSLEHDRRLPTSPASLSSAAGQAGGTTVVQHLQLGDQALAQHSQNPAQLSEARNHFEEVLRADPSNATAHHRLGVIGDLTHDFKQAERHYAQALQRNPRDPQLLHDIGYSYLLQGKPVEAIPYLQQAVSVQPGFEMATRKLADAYVQNRQPELAEQTLRQILPDAEVRQELAQLEAAHDPASRPSIIGRVRDNMRDLRPETQANDDAAQQLLAELERARSGGELARQQRAMQQAAAPRPGATPYWNGAPQQPQLHDSQLSSALANIDRQAAGAVGQPVYIDHQNGGAPVSMASANPWGAAPGGGNGGYPINGTPPGQPGMSPGYAMSPPAGTANAPMSLAETGAPTAPGNASPNPAGAFQYAEVIRGTQRGTASPWEANLAQGRAATQLPSGPIYTPGAGPGVSPAGGQIPANGYGVVSADGSSVDMFAGGEMSQSPGWVTP